MLLLSCNAQTSQDTRKFNFFVSSQLKSFDTVNVAQTNRVDFTWAWDTCSGAIDQNRNQITDAAIVDGQCVDRNGNPLSDYDYNSIFPNGFSVLALRSGFNEANTVNLLPTVTNSAQLVGIRKSLSLNIEQLPSGYYTLLMSAIDINGFLVSGQSPVFIVQNKEPLPAVSIYY